MQGGAGAARCGERALPECPCIHLAGRAELRYKPRVQQNRVDLGTAGGLGAILLWSATFALARSLSEQVGPLTGGAAAYLIGGVVCLLRVGWSPARWARFLRLRRSYLFGCGALFVFYTAAIYLAVGLAKSREQLLEVALVNYLWPTLTVLGSLWLQEERASFWLGPGTALALAGVFLVMVQGESFSWNSMTEHVRSNPAAYALVLAGAVAWALYSNLTRRWSGPEGGGAVDLFVPATGLLLLGLRLLVTEPTAWSLRAGAEACGLSAVTTVAYFLWDFSMRRGNLPLVVACSYFTPLLSTLVSCAYLGVSPSPQLWAGCLLLVAGSLITWRAVTQRQ